MLPVHIYDGVIIFFFSLLQTYSVARVVSAEGDRRNKGATQG